MTPDEMPHFSNFTPTEASYFLSAICNASESQIDMGLLWDCAMCAEDGEDFDDNVSAAIDARDSLQLIMLDHTLKNWM
jgi:oligoribonuclease NrnB/cAMP/cGMP phosphodiesterase (DHH superfamily)